MVGATLDIKKEKQSGIKAEGEEYLRERKDALWPRFQKGGETVRNG